MSCGSVGISILSMPCTGSPSRHWTARFGVARPCARGSTRSLTSCGRPVSRSGDRTDVAGSREAPGSLRPACRADARPARGARALAPSDDATGDEAMGVYAEVRDFVLTHRPCAGPRQANAGPPTVSGHRVVVVCGCGAEFKRWVTLDDADEDLLKSALLAFENQGIPSSSPHRRCSATKAMRAARRTICVACIRSTVGSDDGAMAPRPTSGLPMRARCRRSGTSARPWGSAAGRPDRAGFAGCAVLRRQ